jgi:hypothetical protein
MKKKKAAYGLGENGCGKKNLNHISKIHKEFTQLNHKPKRPTNTQLTKDPNVFL